jgi:hypothetical protein
MFLSAYLLLLVAQPGLRAPVDEIALSPGVKTIDLAWSDVEDRLQGSISPKVPVEEAPIEISAHVGTFQGPEFDGPLTFSFKRSDSKGGGQSKTVKRAAGEKSWRATFVPETSGLHTLEISFATTRMKVASAKIPVGEAKLPRWPWWVIVGLAMTIALGLGVRAVFQKQENM